MKLAVTVLAGAALTLAACQTAAPPPAQAPVASANQPLIDAGFVAKRPTNEAQANYFASLPANAMVRQTKKGKVSYLYADPNGCGCVYVGDKAALGRYKGMQNTMDIMTQQMPGSVDQIDPGLAPDNIDDLGTWAPL
jgi:hypothetical protein